MTLILVSTNPALAEWIPFTKLLNFCKILMIERGDPAKYSFGGAKAVSR